MPAIVGGSGTAANGAAILSSDEARAAGARGGEWAAGWDDALSSLSDQTDGLFGALQWRLRGASSETFGRAGRARGGKLAMVSVDG